MTSSSTADTPDFEGGVDLRKLQVENIKEQTEEVGSKVGIIS